MSTAPDLVPPPASGGREIPAFVAAVRAALDDLPPETVDELTVGLEADLTDARAESGAPQLSASAYAAELRAAAGLPPRGGRDGSGEGGTAGSVRELAAASLERVRAETADLRPAWWVIRGLVPAMTLACVALGYHLFHPVVLVLAALGVWLSVRLGRAQAAAPTPERGRWLIALSVLAVGLAVAGLWLRAAWAGSYSEPYLPQELVYRGEPVRDLYAYGPDGRPVEGIRLLDQSGNPVMVERDDPRTGVASTQAVFPVRQTVDPTAPPDDLLEPQPQWTPPATLAPLPPEPSGATSADPREPTATPTSAEPSGRRTAEPTDRRTSKPTATSTRP